jgi:hypothetical protein
MKIEQRINLKFLVKLKKKTPTECFQLLKEVYDDVMSRTRVLEWHKQFMEGREEVEETNVWDALQHQKPNKISEIGWKDRRLSIRMIAELVNMDKDMVRQILH